MDWTRLADDNTIEKAAKALKARGMEVIVVNNRQDAKRKVLELIPEGAEVMDSTSVTLEEIGVSREIQESGRYQSIRKKIISIDNREKREAFRRRAAAVEFIVGSVHAVTEEGQVAIAAQSGSQLSPYAFGAARVIWVIGTQKIVKNLDEAFRRIKEHCLPLEDARARRAYGVGSSINKILIVEREIVPNRITVVFVKEKVGF